MYKIVLSHALYKDGMEALKGKAEVVIPNDGDSDRIIDELRKADGFILRIGKIDRKAMEQCPNLKVITRPGVGVDNVDVSAATELGIPVVICPAANSRAVAEHALALIFALSKNMIESDSETRKGNFNVRNEYKAVELFGRTVSIIGLGNIGKELAKMCSAIGMKVCAYDPFVDRKTVEQLGYTYCSNLKDALTSGDYISLHMPSLPETRNMISTAEFAAMKPTAFLVNCARGDIVDEAALLDALKTNKISGAGVDVLTQEPMRSDHPLMRQGNVVITPQMAAQTQETTSKTVLMAVEGTLAVLNGQKWPKVANPGVYQNPKWINR